jgi:hypothetical protein
LRRKRRLLENTLILRVFFGINKFATGQFYCDIYRIYL